MKTRNLDRPFIIGLATLALVSCAHQIQFQDLTYNINEQKHNAAITAVIDEETLAKVVTIRSFATGIANRWEAKPGIMLKQVADIELPQMFTDYTTSSTYGKPEQGNNRYTLVLSVPNYHFSDWRATYTVEAVLYGPDKNELFDRTYIEEGASQKAKMVNAGAFGMKSAVRQSSLGALKRIFERLRMDLDRNLTEK